MIGPRALAQRAVFLLVRHNDRMHWQRASAQRDQLGESPFWHPQERRLYWVDIPGRQLRRMDPDQGTVESWPMPQEPGCIAPLRVGGLMVALRDGVYRSFDWGGALTLVARFDYDVKTTRFNDGKADPLGRFWAGTLYEPKDARVASLYSVDLRPDAVHEGQPLIELKANQAITGNGLAWSPDARVVYWADTADHRIDAWDWDPPSNEMRSHRTFARFPPKPTGWKPGDTGYGGRPDGAAVDSVGNYWCAMYEGGRLLRIAPSGQVLSDIPLPVRCPTMPCFGGDDLRTLYITSASHNRPQEELKAFADSGFVIAARVDVPGLPVNFVHT